MDTTLQFSGAQPRQDLTKEQLDKTYKVTAGGIYPTPTDFWYAENVRWGCGFFNINRKPYATNQNSYSGPFVWGFDGEADRAYRSTTYFQGDQALYDYGWLTQLSGGGEMIAPWYGGKETRRFMTNIANKYLAIARNSKPVVKSFDYKSQSEIKKKMELAMMRFDFKEYVDQIKQESGIEFNPAGTGQMTTKDQIEKHFFQNATTTAEIYGTELVDVIREKNSFVSTSFQSFLDLICGGRSMIENTKSYGWPKWESIPSWCQISQGIEDNDSGDNDEVRGWIRLFSPTQIVSREGMRGKTWGEQIRAKYGQEALDKVLLGDYSYMTTQMPTSSGWRFKWFNATGGTIRTGAVARIYWKSLVDTRQLPRNSDPNNSVYYLSDKAKKQGKFATVWRTATLIMNRYVVDEGVCDEIRDPMDLSKLYCPIQLFQPYTKMGYNNSLVETVRPIQDDLSMLDYKFREMVGFDMGIVLRVIGAKIQGGSDGYSLLEEIKKARILVEEESGDPDNYIDQKDTVSRIDFSTVDIAAKYIGLWKSLEQKMKDTLNISDVSLGTNTSYVGFNTQQATMEASSTNLQYHYYGHAQMMNNVIQYSLEQLKIMMQTGETPANEVVLGKRGVYYIKQMKSMTFGSLLCRVDIQDVIDQKEKQALMDNLTSVMAVNPSLSAILDLAKISRMETWGEMFAYLQWREAKDTEKEQGQMLFDKLQAMFATKTQAEAQQNIAALQMEGSKQIADQKEAFGIAKEMMKQDGAMEKHTTAPAQAAAPAPGM